jgi:ABC transporter
VNHSKCRSLAIDNRKRFIASAGTYANLVRQAKSKQKILDKMEAAGLVEKIEQKKPLHFNFEDIRKLPPPIIAFTDVAFSYSGKKEDYLYNNLSFGIEFVLFYTYGWLVLTDQIVQHGFSHSHSRCQWCRQINSPSFNHWQPPTYPGYNIQTRCTQTRQVLSTFG